MKKGKTCFTEVVATMDKPFSKADEIVLLKKLFENDSYFRQAFSQQDREQMLENIRNDHPILLHTGVGIANAICERNNKFERETAQRKFKISARKRIYSNGNPYIEFVVNDPYDEGKLACVLEESHDGTGFVLSAGTKRIPLEKHCDISGGMSRLHVWLSNHTGEIASILGKLMYDLPDYYEEQLEI